MNSFTYFPNKKKYTTLPYYLSNFTEKFWFVPCDILQRSIEANIWHLCKFKNPILDIGVGDGSLSNMLFIGKQQIDMGIDIEKDGLNSARELEISKGKKRYKKVLQANAENMPFKNDSFNTVISNSTFEHITKDTKAISEVARVLKKNGLLFMTVPTPYLAKVVLEYEIKENPSGAQANLDAFNKRLVHLHYRSLKEWEKILNKNGMEIVVSKYYFSHNVALHWYKLFKKYTKRIHNRELWSYLAHSKVTKLLPKKLIINFQEKYLLKETYKNGFFTSNDEIGAQIFIIAKKI